MVGLPFPDRHKTAHAFPGGLAQAAGAEDADHMPQSSPPAHPTRHQVVRMRAGAVELEGALSLPPAARGLVILALDGASGRYCPRNRFMAATLNERGVATLMVDLLTLQEDAAHDPRSDLDLLQRRLGAVVDWTGTDDRVRDLPIGLYGTNTVAAAALGVAASGSRTVAAVVSRGGRPDLAGQAALRQMRTPVLLIVGGSDRELLEPNRAAQEVMGSWAHIEELPGAGHLFLEAGALGQAATMTARFFAAEFAD